MNGKKYRKGRLVEDIGEVFNLPASNPKQMFYFGHDNTRPKHWKVIWNMPGTVIRNAINSGRLWVAEKIQEEK